MATIVPTDGGAPSAGGERDVRYKQEGIDVLGNTVPAVWTNNTPLTLVRSISFRTYTRTSGVVTLTFVTAHGYQAGTTIRVFGVKDRGDLTAAVQIASVTSQTIVYNQAGAPDVATITAVDQNNNPVDVGNLVNDAAVVDSATKLNALGTTVANVVQLGAGGYFLGGPVGISSDTVIKGAYGNGYGGASLVSTANHSLLSTTGSLRAMIDNVSISMVGADAGDKYALDLIKAGQWHVKDVFGSSSNKAARFLRMAGCNNVLMEHVHCMENKGQFIEMLGLTNNVLFVGGSFEATQGQSGQGGYVDCYRDELNNPITTKHLKHINSAFYGMQLERFGTLTIHSGGVTWQDGNVSAGSQIVLSHRSAECKIENTGGRIVNLGSRNVVSRVHALNWSAERPLVIGENALTPIGTPPGQPDKSTYFPSTGTTEYLFWNRLSGQGGGARVRYWHGNHTGSYVDQSSAFDLVTGDFSAKYVAAQDDVTHITCLKGTQARLSVGVTSDSGTVNLHARAYRNLLIDGTFDSGLSSKWAASSVVGEVVAAKFGLRPGLRLKPPSQGGGAWELSQVARLRPGRHYMAIACVKTTGQNGMRLSAGSANDGRDFAQYVVCESTLEAQLTQAGNRPIGTDGGAGDGRQYLQIVWQMPVANTTGLGAFAKISLGGFGALTGDDNYVSWVALVDLDEPKKTLSLGVPPEDHGVWSVGDEVEELSPLVSGYTSWKCMQPLDDGKVLNWGWVGVGEVWKPLPYASSIVADSDMGVRFGVTLAGNVTIAAPLHPAATRSVVFLLKQDAVGGRTVTWDGAFSGSPSGAAGGANQRAMFAFTHNGTTWVKLMETGWF